ncbi:MAG: DegT/DnrJ/EryC1/StrS family aminotransferase [Candidatus Yanofskybacteria bacterium]|nr:DegT/DnrJ/EryC1/StrS family aminotransferase [Candidatus Yanofskybacteria bacterium]
MKKIKRQKNTKAMTASGARFRGNELKYIKEVLDSDLKNSARRSMVAALEKKFAERFHVKYAIASNSGTSTLHQALAAFGVGPGDEVILPALTVVMCGYAIIHMHAKPVYADVDPRTFLIDPADIERKITPRTKAIMAVHFYGQVCDMDRIMAIARKHKLRVLEDCAQCFLGTDRRGRLGGTIGDVGSFSFESTKLVTCGEGGILVTNNKDLATKMRKFGAMGYKTLNAGDAQEMPNPLAFQDPNYLRHDSFGYNYRMAQPLAAIALAQVEKIDWFFKKRQRVAKKYLKAIEGCSWLKPQYVMPGHINAYWTFTVLFEGQEKIGVSWYEFRDKFLEFGGDKCRSAFALVYNEPAMITLNNSGKYFVDTEKRQGLLHRKHLVHPSCPVAEKIQPKLMQFTTNQLSDEEMDIQVGALKKAIRYFENLIK